MTATTQRDFSSPDDVAATTDEINAAMTLIGLNQPDQSTNPFHYRSMYFNMISVPVGLVLNILCIAVTDPGFSPRGGGANSQSGCANLFFWSKTA